MKKPIKQFRLKREHITSVSHSQRISIIDHPEFTKMRNRLEKQGYIQIERDWWNGDRVIKPFSLNAYKFKKHDMFPCASALDRWLSVKEKRKQSS